MNAEKNEFITLELMFIDLKHVMVQRRLCWRSSGGIWSCVRERELDKRQTECFTANTGGGDDWTWSRRSAPLSFLCRNTEVMGLTCSPVRQTAHKTCTVATGMSSHVSVCLHTGGSEVTLYRLTMERATSIYKYTCSIKTIKLSIL